MNSSLYLDDKELAALPQTLPTLQPVALGTGGWALACPHSAVTSAFPDKLHIGEQKCKQFPSKTWHYNSFKRSQLLRCHTYTLVYSYKQWGTFTQFTQSAFKQIRSGCPLYRSHNLWIVQHSENGSVTMTRGSRIAMQLSMVQNRFSCGWSHPPGMSIIYSQLNSSVQTGLVSNAKLMKRMKNGKTASEELLLCVLRMSNTATLCWGW